MIALVTGLLALWFVWLCLRPKDRFEYMADLRRPTPEYLKGRQE